MPLTAKQEAKYMHVRLEPKNKAKILKIIKRTKRSSQVEANLAVEQYKPKLIFKDDGR